MKSCLPFFLSMITCSTSLFAQKSITLLDTVIEIAPKSQVEYVYGFASGDHFELTTTVVSGRLSEISVLNFSDSIETNESRVSTYQYTSSEFKAEDIVFFKFSNKQRVARKVRIDVVRYPAYEDLINYNSEIEWETHVDTIWNLVEVIDTIAFDTVDVVKTEKVLESRHLYEMGLINTTIFVPSRSSHIEGNNPKHLQTVLLSFPEFDNTDYTHKKVKSWAFAVAGLPVGTKATINPAYQPTDSSILPQYHVSGNLTELGAFSLDLIKGLRLPLNSRQYRYYVMDAYQARLFNEYRYSKFIYGNTATAGFHKYSELEDKWNARLYLAFDNINENLNLSIKVDAIALIEESTYTDSTYSTIEHRPIIEKRMEDVPHTVTKKVPKAIGFGRK